MAPSSSSLIFHSIPLSLNYSCGQNPFTMSLFPSPRDMNLLEVICEKQIKILPLSEEESVCTLTSIMHYQEWTKYFMILDKPVYINLVKDFWKHVYINYEDRSISSCIFGIPLNITPFTIARAISCKNTGFTVYKKHNHSYSFYLKKPTTRFIIPSN